MAVLFLDPLALSLLLGLLVYVWLVWPARCVAGSVGARYGRCWPGRSRCSPSACRPSPADLLWLASQVGIEIGDGGVGDAAVYATAYLAPAGALVVWPPRWLLPGWARRRLTPLVAEGGAEVPDGAIPAVQAARGHGSRARWVWRVDGLAGHLWRDGPTLRFRSAPGPAGRLEVDEEMVADLRFADDGELLLATPRGGWWSR
jgi:hypothetical protein